MDFNAGSSVGRRWAELLAASGQLHGRHWAGSHGRRHPGRLLADLETLGFLFESMCVRDLRVYCQMMRAGLSHYRDNTGLEVDTIIRQRNGEWMAAEIKLGGRAAVEAAAASLVKLRDDRIDPTRVGEPRRLVVITATGFAYERTDGVAVVPITALGP